MVLAGTDAPWQGYTYVINKWNSSSVITYNNGSVNLSDYDSTKDTQKWTCDCSDGWLGFSYSDGNTTYYLGFDSYEALHCTATSQKKWEDFDVRKHPDGGYKVFMRKDEGLRPLGENGDGKLAMVYSTDIKWGFNKT